MILGTNETEGSGNFDIGVGPVVKRGQNLPSNKNLADYIDKKGRMNLLDFFSDNEQRFPTLFKIMQHEASCRAVEVALQTRNTDMGSDMNSYRISYRRKSLT
jgi:hypothetical protein